MYVWLHSTTTTTCKLVCTQTRVRLTAVISGVFLQFFNCSQLSLAGIGISWDSFYGSNELAYQFKMLQIGNHAFSK